jgi:hypothetical protein
MTDRFLHSLDRASGPRAAPTMHRARIVELRSILGDAGFDALLGLLITECRDRPQQLRLRHARGDLAGLRAETGSLVGAATSLGAATLSEAARALASSHDLADALPLIEAIDEAARATLCAARQLRGADLPVAANA